MTAEVDSNLNFFFDRFMPKMFACVKFTMNESKTSNIFQELKPIKQNQKFSMSKHVVPVKDTG